MTSQGPRSLADSGPRAAADRDRHIVDVLIQERAPGLLGRPLLGALGRSLLYPLLNYSEAVAVADEMAARDGLAAMRYLSEWLDLDLRVEQREQVPVRGPALVVSNHPTGIADGVVVFDALSPVREDLVVFANRDAVRIAPGLAEVMIPVEWKPEHRTRARTRETLESTRQAFRDDRLVVVFPSGRLAYMDQGRLRERPWMSTAVGLARRHGVPVVPMHIEGRNSRLFYTFSRISEQLRDITLFHEVLNKRQGDYRVRFGEPIPPEALDGDSEDVTRRLQAHVESGLRIPFRRRGSGD